MGDSSLVWKSPDGKIVKEILNTGVWGKKPYFNSECTIEITNVVNSFGERIISSLYLNAEKTYTFTLGFAETAADRELEKCVLQMNLEERSVVALHLAADKKINFTMKLCDFVFNGLIFEWTAKVKCDLASKCKDKGVELFKVGRVCDSSYLFSRGLKFLLSIPIPVTEPVDVVDDVPLAQIQELRANMYNNLASCNLKCELYENVVNLCNRVLTIEASNVKALYKRGVAREGLGEFDKAKEDMLEILKYEACNNVAVQKIKSLNAILDEQNKDYSVMVKKMFKT